MKRYLYLVMFPALTLGIALTGRALVEPDSVPTLPAWVVAVERVGLPVALLIVILWFGVKFIWPFLLQQITVAQKQTEMAQVAREQMQGEFLAALRQQGDLQREHNARQMETMHLITEKLNAMHIGMAQQRRK